MGIKVILSTCALNQWALDFNGNYQRILQSKATFIFIFNMTYYLVSVLFSNSWFPKTRTSK